MKLFLKSVRCYMAKCPIETGRPAPGMHGQRRGRKPTDYGVQLREKQRLKRLYGLHEGQFSLFFKRVARRRGVTGELLLQMLETRLDNIVYRLGFASSRRAARQFVAHGHIVVDGRKCDIPSTILKAAAVVMVKENAKSRAFAGKSMEAGASREVPQWMSLDAKNFSGQLVRIPTREEIAPVVDEQLVVELYSK